MSLYFENTKLYSSSVKYISFSYRFRKKNILDIKITNTTWNMLRLMINNRFKTCFTANGETSFVFFKTHSYFPDVEVFGERFK